MRSLLLSSPRVIFSRRTHSVFYSAQRCLSSEGNRQDYDLVIVGGGPTGLALAAALATSDTVRNATSIALIEGGDLSRVRAWSQATGTFSNRVSSITNANKAFLEDIGVWHEIDESRVASLEDMEVWDGISSSRIQFSASELKAASNISPLRQIAFMTENFNLQRAALRYLDKHPEITLMDNVKVESISPDEPDRGAWPIVQLSNGLAVRARLLVGADGFSSPVKKYARIATHGWAYDTHAIVATMLHRPPYPGTPKTAYQRFLPTGPIAFLPLSDTASSLVWSTNPLLAQALKSLHPEILPHMINAAFRLPYVSIRILNDLILSSPNLTVAELVNTIKWRETTHGIAPLSSFSSVESMGASAVGGYGSEDELPPLVMSVQEGSVAGFPLRMSHAEAYIGEGVGSRSVLVGDAAHTVHPLAGQGLNMGLRDVQVLSQCVEQAVSAGLDIGSHTALVAYPRQQYLENHKMLSVIDKLHKLYSLTWSPAVWARSVGLEVANELEVVKSMLMASAGSEVSGINSFRQRGGGGLQDLASFTAQRMVTLGYLAEDAFQNTVKLGSAIARGMSLK